MKSGREYEEFVYEKLRRFYPDFVVTLDDKIRGNESGILRQIDVSIRGKVSDVELLYLVQCKDHSRPADIGKIGEFSSVIKDVGASKGFLICAAGFARTIHQYARTLGIELLTVEDINSETWCAEVEIPVIYIKNSIAFKTEIEIIANRALVRKNRRKPIKISKEDFQHFSLDKGKTAMRAGKYVDSLMKERNTNPFETDYLDITNPKLMVRFAGIWTGVGQIGIHFAPVKAYYLKYISPAEYSHIRNHLNGAIIPLNLAVKELSLNFDESYVEINEKSIPIVPGFSFQIEETPSSFDELNIDGLNLLGVESHSHA